jgi:hypothetical protein
MARTHTRCCLAGALLPENIPAFGRQTADTMPSSASIARVPMSTSSASRMGLYRKPAAPYQLTQGPMLFGEAMPTPDGKKLLLGGYVPRSELVQYTSDRGSLFPSCPESRPISWTSREMASGSFMSPSLT